MDLGHGLLLGFIGCTLTVIGFGIALYFGSRTKKEVKYEDLSTVQKSLWDLLGKKR